MRSLRRRLWRRGAADGVKPSAKPPTLEYRAGNDDASERKPFVTRKMLLELLGTLLGELFVQIILPIVVFLVLLRSCSK